MIPVIVLSGFLGSGKTTLLLRLVHAAKERGLAPAILINELGQLDMDGHIVQSELPGLTVEKLLDGCICCDKKSELTGSVEYLIRRAPDLIIIELSGVANPEEIADCLTDPQLLNRVALKQVVTVLDAELVLEYNSVFASDRSLVQTFRAQMAVADMLLLNKADLVSTSKLIKIEKTVRKHNVQARIICTTFSQVDTGAMLDGISPSVNPSTEKRRSFHVLRHTDHNRASYSSESELEETNRSYSRLKTIVLNSTTPLKPKKVEQLLQNCGRKLLRAKGYLQLERERERDVRLMQFAGNRVRWQPTAYKGELYLILIGLELDGESIRREWSTFTS